MGFEMLELFLIALVIVCCLFAGLAACGMLIAFRVFHHLIRANGELQLQVLALSKDANAAHYAGFKASAEENRKQAELLERLRVQRPKPESEVDG